MPDSIDPHRRWEVRPTLRLRGIPVSEPPDQATRDVVADALRQHPSVAFAVVGCVIGLHSVGITATILFAHPSTPGKAVDQATTMFARAAADAGLTADMLVEVVAEPGGVDPRTLL